MLLCLSATLTQWVAHLPWNMEDVGSNPGTGRYIVSGVTT